MPPLRPGAQTKLPRQHHLALWFAAAGHGEAPAQFNAALSEVLGHGTLVFARLPGISPL
jgi:hypothetical protein